MRDINDIIPWEIPQNWAWCCLGNIAEMSIGKTPPRGEQKYWTDGKYSWVSISDLDNGGMVLTTKEKVSDDAFSSIFNGQISKAGSLIMSFKLTIGKISILGIDAFHNEAIVTIIPLIKDYAIKEYFMTILPYMAQLGNSKDAIKGKTLNSKSLFNIWIPLPPKAEISRILERLKDIGRVLQSD